MTEKLQVQLTFAYRDICNAGIEPLDVEVGSSNMKELAEKGAGLFKAINEADAAIFGRKVAPIIPALDKTLMIVNLITGWKVTSGLASKSQESMVKLQNALSLANAGLSLTSFGKFLPLFAHFGPLLDSIAKGWGRIVSQLQKQNQTWWQLRDLLGEEVMYSTALPGGKAVMDYMKATFRLTQPFRQKPSNDIVEFFEKNRKMFSATAKEVIGRNHGVIPTESSWMFCEDTDPDRLNSWVFYNKEMVWRLIYGSGWVFP